MSYEYQVALGDRSYPIHIEMGCLSQMAKALNALFAQASRCVLVSNDIVAPLYADVVEASLVAEGWQVQTCILPDGEQYKTMQQWSSIVDALMQARVSRSEPIIALGGGVVGDMTGFAAACYRRGIPYIQVPTSLLSQVDSSVGGKTAINHPHGKNMIGAFYQPRLVWIDPAVLQTLEPRQYRSGLAEVMKYGLIRDASFCTWLDTQMPALLSLQSEPLMQMIFRSCQHKAEVVAADETEQGQRALLNLGHTFGHAIESMTYYKRYYHGEAVAIGMLMAAQLSESLAYAPTGVAARVKDLLLHAGLPVAIPKFSADAWLDAMGHDKKNVGRSIRYVLLRDIGDAFLAEDVPSDVVRAFLKAA